MNADDYITFEDCVVPDTHKTQVVRVNNRRSSATLGTIRWFGAWHQYCFYPALSIPTVFNMDCLRRIADVTEAMTAAHKSHALRRQLDR